MLLVYTLTQAAEPDRFPATAAFFQKIAVGNLLGATSFYALQEVHIFAIDNASDFPTVVLLHQGGEGYEVEFVTLDGATLAVTSVFASQMRPAMPNELPHARRVEPAQGAS